MPECFGSTFLPGALRVAGDAVHLRLIGMQVPRSGFDSAVTRDALQCLDVVRVFSELGQSGMAQSMKPSVGLGHAEGNDHAMLSCKSVRRERLAGIAQRSEHVIAFRLREQLKENGHHGASDSKITTTGFPLQTTANVDDAPKAIGILIVE